MKKVEAAKRIFIESAVRVVAREGLEKTTTKAIAAAAGLNEAYIYRCFESKEELLRTAFHLEDVSFAYFLRKKLSLMHDEALPWKERAFRLWRASWRFALEKQEDCCFYLQYYYSAGCRKYAYEEHLRCFHELIACTSRAFKPGTNVDILVHQIFDTMLSFAARVMSGEIEDCEDTTRMTFEQVYSFVVPHVRGDRIEKTDGETNERDDGDET